jgi:hypothetical protein
MKTAFVNSTKRFSSIVCAFGPKTTIHPTLAALVFAIAFLSVQATPLWATDHSGPITSDTTWYAADNPHVIVSGVTVQAGVTLTLEDGVEVRFNSGQWISVYGTLTAVGTPGTGIVFTRSGASNGSGLYFYTNGGGRFEYCTIEHVTYGIQTASTDSISLSHCTLQNNSYGVYATGGTVQLSSTTLTNNTSFGFYGSGVAPTLLDANNIFENSPTGIYLWDISGLSLTTAAIVRDNTIVGVHLNSCGGHPTLDNLTFQGNGGTYGAIYMQDTGEFTIGGGNTIGGSGQENNWPLAMNITSYPSAASSGNIPSSGNTNNGIQVYGGSTAGSITWPDVGVEYIVTVSPAILASGILDVDDHVTVKFDHAQGIGVYGTLNAAGSGSILFTRYELSDQWDGLRFFSGSSGILKHCTIEHATYSTGYGIYADGFLPTIENCTIRYNDYGLYVQNTSTPALSAANTIQDNNIVGVYFFNCTDPLVSNQTITGHTTSYGAICMDNSGEFTIGGGNTIGGGGQENSWPLSMNIGSYPSAASSGQIPSSGNVNNEIQVYGGSTADSVAWRDVGLDYIVTNSPIILAGGMLEVDDDITVKFEHGQGIGINGTLNARGTGNILFTRRESDDQWAGLQFQSGSSGTLQHCTIEHATYSAGYGIYTSSGADTISLVNCTIQNNRYGVRASGGALNFRNNQIIDNADYGIHLSGAISPSFGGDQSQWNDIYGNGGGNDGRDLHNGTLDLSAPYIYWGTVVEAEIQAKIWDKDDDPGLGVVDYTPWSDASHCFTPHTVHIDGSEDFKDECELMDSSMADPEYGGDGGYDYLHFTWDEDHLYIGYEFNDFNNHGDLFVYFDSHAGGTNSSTDWYVVHEFPPSFIADYAICIEEDLVKDKRTWNGGGWEITQWEGTGCEAYVGGDSNPYTEISLPDTEIAYDHGDTLKFMVYCQEETSGNLWIAFPSGNSHGLCPLNRYYLYESLDSGVQPNTSFQVISEDAVPPAAPTGPTVIKAGDDIFLHWPPVDEDTAGCPEVIDYYVILRDIDPGSLGMKDSLDVSADTSYLDQTAAVGDAGVQHYYAVVAVDGGANKSAFSEAVGEFDKDLTRVK